MNSHSEVQSPLVPLRLGHPQRTRNTGEPEGKMCGGQMEMGKDGGQQARAGRQEEGEVPTESPWLKLGVSAGRQSLLWGGQ